MEMMRHVLDVGGWFLMGLATIIAAEALRKLAGWREDVTISTLRRRLADVEALRRREALHAKGGFSDYTVSRYIERLRADEGDSITILCDDPEGHGERRMAIECNGSWTGWADVRFYGESVLQCLAKAVLERDKADNGGEA